MRRRTTLMVVVAAVALLLVLGAAPAGARELLGCDGVLQWPCPGPVL